MCSGLNHARVEKLKAQMADALANDHSHTKRLSEN